MILPSQNIVDFSSNSRLAQNNGAVSTLSSISAWKAFQSGMHILQRYANRAPIDIQSIAKSNLRLLHRSLSYETEYAVLLENTRRESVKSGLTTLRRLYTNRGLIADLLALQKDTSINLVPSPQCCTMYLLVSGSAQIGLKSAARKLAHHWWARIVSNTDNKHLCNGDVVFCTENQASNRLTAAGKDCLLLRVQSPTVMTPCMLVS